MDCDTFVQCDVSELFESNMFEEYMVANEKEIFPVIVNDLMGVSKISHETSDYARFKTLSIIG